MKLKHSCAKCENTGRLVKIEKNISAQSLESKLIYCDCSLGIKHSRLDNATTHPSLSQEESFLDTENSLEEKNYSEQEEEEKRKKEEQDREIHKMVQDAIDKLKRKRKNS